MANLNLNSSFQVVDPHLYQPIKFLLNASYAAKNGDAASLGTDGYATDTLTAVMLGIQQSGIIQVSDSTVDSAASSSDATHYANFVVDVNVMFKGKISTFTATDPYTTRSGAACYDIDNTTAGQQFINAAAHSLDQIKVVALSTELDTGLESAVGSNAQVFAKINPLSHFLGPIA